MHPPPSPRSLPSVSGVGKWLITISYLFREEGDIAATLKSNEGILGEDIPIGLAEAVGPVVSRLIPLSCLLM